jgi:two-component system, chemotaxis family, sensor kinase CheA
MSMNESLQQELVKDLLVESYEGLDQFDRELLGLEQGQGGNNRLNIIFRVIHTIKGTAGCIGLGRIEKVAHSGENLMSLLRDGKLTATGEIISAPCLRFPTRYAACCARWKPPVPRARPTTPRFCN